MIYLTISFILGIAAFNLFPYFPFSISLLSIVTALVIFFMHRDRKRTLQIVFIFIFGFLYSFMRSAAVPDAELPKGDVAVHGTVADVPEISNDKLRFRLDHVNVNGSDINGRISMVVSEELSEGDISEKLFYGDRVDVIARVRKPPVLRNPGVYAYDPARHGIAASGYVTHLKIIKRADGLMPWIFHKRQELAHIIDNSLTPENASLHKAIIPGLKRSISIEMRDAFGMAGLAHLLSISGTHFGLLGFIIFSLIRLAVTYLPESMLRRMTLYITPSQVAVVFTLPVLFMYAFMSGLGTPAVRSLIMVFIYMLALYLGRRGQWLNSLSIAAFIILLWQPGALLELSFQLSFLAVLFIGYVLENMQKPDDDILSSYDDPPVSPLIKVGIKIKTGLLITFSAMLGTAPLVLIYFKQFSLISPVTNLIITPLVCFLVLPLGFFSGFAALLLDLPHMPLSGLIDAVTNFSLVLINYFSDMPFTNAHPHSPSLIMIIFYYAALGFFIRAPKLWKIVPLVMVLCFYFIAPKLSGDELRVTFLDVGQGESSVVELPDGKVMLIDGGEYKPDMGRRVVAPFLWARGIDHIDYLVLTHPHPDHYGGLSYVLDNFRVGEVWTNRPAVYKSGRFFSRVEEKDIPYKLPVRGDVFDAGEYKINILHPYEGFYPDSSRGGFSNLNSGSIVMKISSNNTSVLFTGDIEAEAENDLVYLGEHLKSSIIKVPHHGGRSSSSADFISAVRPETAVISVGGNNTYGHPHRETLARYKNAGTDIYRTDKSGAVTVTLEDGSYRVGTYEESRVRKVEKWQDEVWNLKSLF